MVGPEQPLCDGISDFLEKEGIKVIGCNSYCANLESSKNFTKEICDKQKIPTAKYKTIFNNEEGISYLKEKKQYPIVVKADGLAAGKGVIIAENEKEAINAIKEIFSGKFGENKKIVVEDFLTGVEASVFAISDGKDFKLLSSAGDHKRIGDGDVGLNTGGMGAYSPSPFVTKEVEDKVVKRILEPTFDYFQKLGTPYIGVIFAGLMIDEAGDPFLIEYNIRFGDPETQSILTRLETDFLEILQATASGNLAKQEIKFLNKKSVTLVLAASGYPESYQKGANIDLSKITENVEIFYAGIKKNANNLVSNGGRVLNLTATEDSFKEAIKKTYQAAEKVIWVDKYYRTDIASKVSNL